MAPPSDNRDGRERRDGVDTEELVGVDTERSRNGMASSASEGEMLGDGELDLCTGEATLLAHGLSVVSAM